MSYAPFTGAKRLRALLEDKSKILVCPGVYDGISARVAVATGFEALYMTGAGTSMAKLGWADLGIATLDDMAANVSMIASLDPSVPVISDADTGYGGPVMVSRTVAQYARAGVAALHIEDQVQEKRCGHLLGKEIVSREVYYARLRAAVAVKKDLQSDMQIIARTDSRQKYGLEEALTRMADAVKIGVDIVFLEGLESKEEAQKFCSAMGDTPCLLNMVTGGVTPTMTVQEAKAIGFRLIIFPGASLGPVVRVLTKELAYLLDNGKMSPENAGESPKSLFNLCGLQDCIEIDKRAGGVAYSTVGQ